MTPQLKAALQDLFFKAAGGISDMANEELIELDRILQPEIERLVVVRVDELVTEVLGYYAEDVFTPASKKDYDRMNSMDKNLNTRLHCSGIRHGLHQLRRAARGLSAREDLEVIRVPALTQLNKKEGE